MKKTVYLLGSLFVPGSAFAQNDFTDCHGMWNWGGMMGWSGWFWPMMILWVVLWILGIVALILFLRWVFTYGSKETGKEQNALDIIKERYAKGEINKEKYEEMKKDLKE